MFFFFSSYLHWHTNRAIYAYRWYLTSYFATQWRSRNNTLSLTWHHRHHKYSKINAKCVYPNIMAWIFFLTLMNNKGISKLVCTWIFSLRQAKLIIWLQWTVCLGTIVILHFCCHSHSSNDTFALFVVMDPSFKFQFLVLFCVLQCGNIQVLIFVIMHLKNCTKNDRWTVKIIYMMPV